VALTVVCRENNGTVRCVLKGELDLAAETSALDELTPVIERGPDVIVFDLSGVEFIDSTGLRVLLTCRSKAAEAGSRLVLTAPSNAVQRLLEVTKLADRFEVDEGG
jgi:anti-sigma B factor antagonist